MQKIKIAITGCLGKMGQELIKASNKDKQIEIVSLTESKKYNKKINKLLVQQNSLEAFKKADLIIDFTTPSCTMQILKIISKMKKKIIIGTTGFSEKQEKYINKLSKKIPILKSGNMSLGVNLLLYITQLVSQSLPKEFLFRVSFLLVRITE